MATRVWHLPVRLAAGAYILDQGISKLGLDEQRAARLRDQAAIVNPRFADLDPEAFAQLLSLSEVALGVGLLGIGVVPPGLAGLGLVGFGGSLVSLYVKAPGMRQDDGLRPTPQGMTVSKDIWLLAMGAALVLDALFGPRRRRRRRRS